MFISIIITTNPKKAFYALHFYTKYTHKIYSIYNTKYAYTIYYAYKQTQTKYCNVGENCGERVGHVLKFGVQMISSAKHYVITFFGFSLYIIINNFMTILV